MATQYDDTINVMRGSVGGAGGNDTLVISGFLVDDNAEITLTDSVGSNTIQLIAGLEIVSSQVGADSALLTLSNGAEVTVLEASGFTFGIGGDPAQGDAGVQQDWTTFVTETLGYDAVPTSGTDSSDDTVIIGESTTSDLPDLPDDGGPAAVTEGTSESENITGNQDGATLAGAGGDDRFIFDDTPATVIVSDFASGDQFYFDGFTPSEVTVSNADPTDGVLTISATDLSITVQGVDEPAAGLINDKDSFRSVYGDDALMFGG